MFDTHCPLHRWKPPLHVNPHSVPLHLAVAFAGAVHGVQLSPHDDTLSLRTHSLLQSWVPLGHGSHKPLLQARSPQFTPQRPQFNSSLNRSAHMLPHMLKPGSQLQLAVPYMWSHEPWPLQASGTHGSSMQMLAMNSK